MGRHKADNKSIEIVTEQALKFPNGCFQTTNGRIIRGLKKAPAIFRLPGLSSHAFCLKNFQRKNTLLFYFGN